MRLSTPAAILLAGALIAAAVVVTNRYQLSADRGGVWRVDALTGETSACVPVAGQGRVGCISTTTPAPSQRISYEDAKAMERRQLTDDEFLALPQKEK